jgi:aspartyl/asparaginyl beta-hydroxylase (cupin superfamily)
MKKFIFLFLFFMISTASAEPSLKEIKEALETTRKEIVELGHKYYELAEAADNACDKSDLFELLDILIRMGVYILDRSNS